jgi:hypothetical protein
MISEPMVCLAQIVYLSYVKINTISKWTETSFHFDPHHVGVPSVAPEIISKPMALSAQTVHLLCVEINTISKWTKLSFHFTHVT